ncbi:hypothetical protein OU798_21630 [Prolixibacteraceae bacterium Z1-6]|uniref:Uncharacterized protein n=1 Tax=Draconibacterium aestuarii TaxID=2998507 RepID=A0A9X3FHU5_9BACT|nr:hypothetical protein [Prolixibacteraceae bacterium Z1-6]
MAVALVAIAMLGMAIQILLKKGGKFPNTHVGGNKYLKSQGIHCATTQDKLAQRDARKQMKFKSLHLANNSETDN